jgi:hypothetical protein
MEGVVMRKKMVKLILATTVLAGGLLLGSPAKPASAAGFCQDQCCDAWCTSVRHCFGAGGSCFCEEFCSVGIDIE